MRPILAQFTAKQYAEIKAGNPGKGRRYWQLRALQEFWSSNPSEPGTNEPTEALPESVMNALTEDDDPCDILVSDVIGGVVVRTDFSNEEAWNVFTGKLKVAENELNEGAPSDPGSSSQALDVDMEDGNGSQSSDEEEEGKLIKIINPTRPEERAIFHHISNLRALRLLNDVDVRPAPPVPSGTSRISPPNPLVDAFGWQEIYTGVTLWIYDSQSNSDYSARLVSLESDLYGTATGDSWRAQVSRIPDLQLSMTFENMKISFGGLDRWDYSERKRNLEEVGVLGL